MGSVITCKKCGTATPYAGATPMECPACGVIYAKASSAPRREAVASRTSRLPSGATDDAMFVAELRERTNYPAFRAAARISAWLLYLVAAASLVGGLLSKETGATIGGIAASILFCIVGRILKEASLMLADLSDAAIHTSRNSSQK